MMPTTKRETPTPMLVSTALLVVYGVGAALIAWQEESWVLGIAALLAVAACIGTALLRGWSRYLVYALTLAYVVFWGASLWQSSRAGYFELLSTREILISQSPSAALACLSALCSWLVARHFRGAGARR